MGNQDTFRDRKIKREGGGGEKRSRGKVGVGCFWTPHWRLSAIPRRPVSEETRMLL